MGRIASLLRRTCESGALLLLAGELISLSLFRHKHINPEFVNVHLMEGSHDAALKLQLLTHSYWLTRDRDFVQQHLKIWLAEAQHAIKSLERKTGLLPPQAHHVDITTIPTTRRRILVRRASEQGEA